MLLYLWKNFNKRSNSTKLPGTPDASLNVKLKEDTSIESPSFILSGQEFEYNYAQAFGHYYFINDIVSLANGLIQINCTQDVLATYRSDILASRQYVLYSSSNYDTNIADPRVVVKASTITEGINSDGTGHLSTTGCYALTVANADSVGVGASTTYIMTSDNVATLINYFNSSLIDEPLDWLQTHFLKPFDAVIKCVWLPLTYNNIGGTVADVKIGKDANSGAQGKRVVIATITDEFTINFTMTHHYSDFRKAQPYSHMQLYIPFYGMLDINPLDFLTELKMSYHIDVVTGDTTIQLKDGSFVRSTINFCMGVDCPLSQVTTSGNGIVSSIAGVAAGVAGAVASGGASAVASGIGAVSSGINGILKAAQPTTSVKGGVAGRSMIDLTRPKIYETSSNTSDPADLTAIAGRPCMQYLTLSSLSGYCQCGDASVNMAGLANDKTEVNSLLNSGIYIE